jgi:hypothetical protein
MRALPLLVAGVGCAFFLDAQAIRSDDVALTVDGPAGTFFGQFCGPVPCQPMPGPAIAVGSTRFVTHNAAASTPFAIAIGTPVAVCIQVPGIANGLLLAAPAFTLAIGVTGPPVPGPCPRGVATVPLAVPAAAPPGLAFHLQSIGVSWSGQLAFSEALAATTR